MKPYFQDDGITIYHGDCCDILPNLERVELLITDVPYGEVNRSDSGLRSLDRGQADEETFTIKDFLSWIRGVADSYYVWCSANQFSEIRRRFINQGLSVRSCFWKKTNPSPMNGSRLWLSGIEHCVFARDAKAYFSRHCEVPVWEGPTAKIRLHETPKPEWLFDKQIVASCPNEGTVLDPCMGSGTALRVAYDYGMSAIGIDTREKCCEVAARRLSKRSFQFPKAA